jgi:hypothetical protein
LSEAVGAAECVLFDASEAFLSALDRFDAKHYPQTGAFGSGGGGGGSGSETEEEEDWGGAMMLDGGYVVKS